MLQYWPLSFKGFVVSCSLSLLHVVMNAPRWAGSNFPVFMWLQVIVGPRLGWPRHFSTGLPKPVCYREVGKRRAGGWGGANDVKTSMVICLKAGWWWWLVASQCCVDWCWPVLSYVALPCGTYYVNIVIARNPLVLKRPDQWWALWCAAGKGQCRSRIVGTVVQ